MLAVTYADSHSSAIQSGEVTWSTLLESLAGLCESNPCTLADCARSDCEHKKSSPMWGPVRFRAGSTRKTLENVEGVSLLCVDVDHVKTNDELIALYDRVLPWRHFVHGTHSDQTGDRCVRVGIATSREMTPSEYRRVRVAVVDMLDLPEDQRVRDASRLYYAPSRPSDALGDQVDGTGYMFLSGDGKVLEVDAILALCGEDDTVVDYSDVEFEVPDFDGGPEPEQLERAAQILGRAWPDDDRHAAQLALCGALARAGWPADLIAQFAARVAQIDEPGSKKHVELAPASARDSVRGLRENKLVTGWPNVVEYCGEDAVREAREALGMLGAGVLLDDEDEDRLKKAIKGILGRRAENVAEEAAEVVEAMQQEETPSGPTYVEVEATLDAAKRRLIKSNKPRDAVEGKYLAMVRSGEKIYDAQEALDAAVAVVRHAPADTTDDQVRRVMMVALGDRALRPDLIATARAREETTRRVQVEEPADQFSIVKTGPRVGKPENKQHNLAIALQRLGITLSYDQLAESELIEWEDESGAHREYVEDHHVNALFMAIESNFDIQAEDGYFSKWIGVQARERSFHPVRDYLDSLDPNVPITGACDEWLIRYAGAPDTPFVRAVSRLFLVAAVRRVRRPGCKFDELVILEGPQGYGKSTMLKALAVNPDWFTDNFDWEVDDRQKFMEQISGKWLIESGELSNMSRRDHKALKKCLSQVEDRARAAYGRRVRTIKRQCLIVGSTNDDEYLIDPTGNRRYWPIRISRAIDIDAFKKIVPQLWAEASRLERENPDDSYIRLSPELYKFAGDEQAQREVQSPYMIILDDAFASAVGRILITDVWKLFGFTDGSTPSQPQMNQIAADMQRLGWKKNRHRIDKKRSNYYERGTGPELDIILTTRDTGSGWKVCVQGTARTPPATIGRPARSNDPETSHEDATN